MFIFGVQLACVEAHTDTHARALINAQTYTFLYVGAFGAVYFVSLIRH